MTFLVQTMAIHALYHDGHLACGLPVLELLSHLQPLPATTRRVLQMHNRCKVLSDNTYRSKRISGFG